MAPTATSTYQNRGSIDDPFNSVLKPPANETLAERDTRVRLEAEAKKISDAIDEEIKIEKELLKKRKQSQIKLLLLGQSESGKSTTVKQFQLLYAPDTLELERTSWRTVVYINVVKSLRSILDALDYDHQQKLIAITAAAAAAAASPPTVHHSSSGSDSSNDNLATPATPKRPHSAKTEALLTLRLRLSPLLIFEKELTRKLNGLVIQSSVEGANSELLVRSGWQASYPTRSSTSSPPTIKKKSSRGKLLIDSEPDQVMSAAQEKAEEMDMVNQEVAVVLGNCKEDIKKLWNHPTTAAMMKKRRFRMEDWSGFFLDDLDRIASPDYTPTDEDILRARLRTLGIMEYQFDTALHISTGNANKGGVSWHLYDVGGARGQRHAWASYFEDANSIIFLAPISAFDQYLEEDPRINRVDDSLQLFTAICNNPLLKGAHLVLFLNKMDILKKKLDAGVKVKRYITSYGDRPNDLLNVTHYFKAHFQQVHKKGNDLFKKNVPAYSRELYTHMTSVVDTKATRNIIKDVNDSIFRDHLKSSSIL